MAIANLPRKRFQGIGRSQLSRRDNNLRPTRQANAMLAHRRNPGGLNQPSPVIVPPCLACHEARGAWAFDIRLLSCGVRQPAIVAGPPATTTWDTVTGSDWSTRLVDQLDWHWQHQLRPRLDGLTDNEYFWEPTTGCWSVRPRGTSTAPIQAGSGAFTIDFAMPEPDPPPVTTIAWRLGHLIVGVLGSRASNHFGAGGVDYETFDYAGTAVGALGQLDEMYDAWVQGCADSVTKIWHVRADRWKDRSPTTRWPSSCCTSTVR
jgi:DinB superfamily